MSSILLKSDRKSPSLQTIGGDIASHTRALEAIRDILQIRERRTGDLLNSFVRVQELIDLGIVRIVGGNRVELALDPTATGGGGDDNQTAAEVPYTNTTSGLSATDVQNAIDEVVSIIDMVANTDDQTAAEVPYDNSTSGLAATDVQDAIDELKDDITAAASGTGSSSALATEILADTPTAYWKCSEASGSLADSSGNGFTLNTLTGTIDYQTVELIPGDATKFTHFRTAAGAQITGTLGLTVPLTGDYSIEGILYGYIPGAVVFGIGGTGESTASNLQARLQTDSTTARLTSFWETTSSGTDITVSGPVIAGPGPYHLVIVKDGTADTLTFYVNGRYAGTQSYSTEPTGGTSANTGIGAIAGSSSNAMGVGHVAFYNGIKLSAARVKAHAQAAGMY